MVKPKVNVRKLLGFLGTNIATFLFPLILSLFISWISSTIIASSTFDDVFHNFILDEIMYSVLSLSIMGTIAYLFYADKVKESLGKIWSFISKFFCFICGAVNLALFAVAIIVALEIGLAFFQQKLMILFVIECVGACCCAVLQCLTHSEVYMVH